METQRFRYLHLRPYAFVLIAGYAPAFSPLRSLHIFRQRGGQSHFQPPFPLIIYNLKSTSCLPQHKLTPASGMATVDTLAQTRFCDSFSALTEDIREKLYVGQATAADVHWNKWAYFYARVALEPLLVAYKDPVPIFSAFNRDYRTGNIDPNSRAVRSRTVENSVQSIGQVIAMQGAKDPRMTSTVNIDGRLQL